MIGVTLMDAAFDRDAKKPRCWTSSSSPYRSRISALNSIRDMP